MSEYRQASLSALKEIDNEKQALRFRWDNSKDSVFVDVMTAHVMLEVHKFLTGEERKQKFENGIAQSREKFLKLANLCMSFI